MASAEHRGDYKLHAARRSGGNPSRVNPTSYNSPPSGLGLSRPEWGEIKSTSKLDLQKGKLRWGGEWVEHDIRETKHFLGLGPPSYSFTAIMNSPGSEALKAELCRFLLCLKLWETTPGEKAITPSSVWVQSLCKGPAFAEELDDLFQLSWRERDIESYNFVFPCRFLPRFKEYTNDINWSLEPTYADPDSLEEFSQTLDEILSDIPVGPESILVDDRSILEDRTTTTSYLPSEQRTLPHWEASFLVKGFNTKSLIGQRCVVNVYPGGTRDTVIASKDANNSVRWIERVLKKVLTYIPESAITSYTSVFHKRLEDVIHKRGHHVLRDIKKCGLTYNSRELFPIVKEALSKRFPDNRWNRIDIFQDIQVYDDDKVYHPVRGYCLGMANALVTLCNIVIYYICINRMRLSSRIQEFKTAAIVGNDDADVVFYGRNNDTREAAQEYLNTEHDVQGGLGNLTNIKKSVVMPFGLFYEQYSKPGWRTKESLICNAIACAYLAPDIRTAKNYIFSQSDRFVSKWAIQQLVDLATYWGPEFYSVEDELKSHYEVGGWLDLRQLGLKTTLLDIDRLSERYSLERISFTVKLCKRYSNPPRPEKKRNGLVYNSLYTGPAVRSDPDIQLWTLVDDDLIEYYKKLTSFQRSYERRLSTFRLCNSFKTHKSYEELHRSFLGNSAWYCIPDSISYICSSWEESLSLDISSEFCSADVEEQRPENKLARLARNEEFEPVASFRLRPDPMIPVEAMKSRVYAPIGTLFQSAAFSNSGALPILEFFSRNSRIPLFPDWVPGTFVQSKPIGAHLSISIKSRHEKRKDVEELSVISDFMEVHDAWESTPFDHEEEYDEYEDFFGVINEYSKEAAKEKPPAEPPDIPLQAPEPTALMTDEDLRVIEEIGMETEIFGDYMASIRRRAYEGTTTIEDNEDEDYGLGFGDDADY